MFRSISRFAPIALLALVVGCESNSSNPLSPSGSVAVSSDVNADGSTLKVSAPAVGSPSGAQKIDTRRPTLVASNASGRFANIGLAYQFQVFDSAGNLVYEAIVGAGESTTEHQVNADLNFSTAYSWRVRAALENETGPWSGVATFVTPDDPVVIAAPAPISPIGGGAISTITPEFVVTNGAVIGPAGDVFYRFQVATEANFLNPAIALVARDPSGTTRASVGALAHDTAHFWRVQGTNNVVTSAFSATQTFRTPVPGPTLPFAIPAACGPFGPENRFGCAAGVASQSAEWARCARGDGLGCHRFTRQVAFALSRSDPNWRIIRAAPGGHACHCNGCGPSDGNMFREDTVVYGGNRVFDMITGAGGPSPGLSWSSVPGPRSEDTPTDVVLCQ